MIINARSEDEIHAYMRQTGMYYEIIDDAECQYIEDVELAGSILFEDDRFYKEDQNYNTIIECLRLIKGV
jgi:hypothetical protein